MTTQQEFDLEARLADMERQIAELKAIVNPLYSGGMDRYIHSGYMQWDGINLRLDKNGIQLPADGVNRSILFFLQKLATDPTAVLRKSQLIGNVSDSAANIIMNATTSGVSVSASAQANASSFFAYWTASMGGNVYQLDFQASSGADWGLLTLTKGYLRIVGGSSDPAGVADGAIWYNTTTAKLYARINGVTKELGGGGMSLIVKEADETVNNSAALQDDNELLFAVAANEVWQFEGVLFGTIGTSEDFQMTFTGPTGAVGSFGAISTDATGSGSDSAAAQLGTGVSLIFASAGGIIRFWGGIHNGANAGNLTLRWSQNSAVAVDTIIRAGSYIKYMKET